MCRQKGVPSTTAECDYRLLCSEALLWGIFIISELMQVSLEGHFLVPEPQLLQNDHYPIDFYQFPQICNLSQSLSLTKMYLWENIILFNTLLIISNYRDTLNLMNLSIFFKSFFFLGAVYSQMLSSLCAPPKHKVEFSSCAPDIYGYECLYHFCTRLLPSQGSKCPCLSLDKAVVSGKSRSKGSNWRNKDS